MGYRDSSPIVWVKILVWYVRSLRGFVDGFSSEFQVAAYLENACKPDGSNWNVVALEPGKSYIGERTRLLRSSLHTHTRRPSGPTGTQVNYCGCSSVVYAVTAHILLIETDSFTGICADQRVRGLPELPVDSLVELDQQLHHAGDDGRPVAP